jgi:hypothetical protein
MILKHGMNNRESLNYDIQASSQTTKAKQHENVTVGSGNRDGAHVLSKLKAFT